ncbi:sensor histidine kinase [Planctomycetota bacterium]
MRKEIHKIYHRILVFLHLSPLSLAEKCRIAFGGAVIVVLGLALLLPYFWMDQLTKKALLDAGSAKAETVIERHFQPNCAGETVLTALSSSGDVLDVNNPSIMWVRFTTGSEQQFGKLSAEQIEMIETLRSDESSHDNSIELFEEDCLDYSNYVKIFRANENCMKCHNAQGSAAAFSQNEMIGAVVVKQTAGEVNWTFFINRICIIIAGLIGGAGAIVAFYIITQRVILRPIRQLRGVANNVAEGNLNVRSSINTRDEYEKLSDAFNNMLDALQAAQEKQRATYKQLDEKIAELSSRNIELFRANKVKSEFLANISHEFRTPLNAILGFAEILRDNPKVVKKEKGKRYSENIITAGKNLLNMINDLLDLAKSEAGKIKVHIDKVDAAKLCETIVLSFSALTKNKRIKVKLKVDDNIGEIMTDGGKVQQVLYNFLSNAVKFTPENGRIEMRVSMVDEKTVRFAVSDTGCGIADGDKEAIFEKFRQADGSITRQGSGSGLGLAISKDLAAMLAGVIGLESELEKGSTFWLDIPVTLTLEEDMESAQ